MKEGRRKLEGAGKVLAGGRGGGGGDSALEFLDDLEL